MEENKTRVLLEKARMARAMSQKRIQALINFNQQIVEMARFSDDPSVVLLYTELDNCIGKIIKFEGTFQDISSIESQQHS